LKTAWSQLTSYSLLNLENFVICDAAICMT
jgi:hypothetical protein